MTLRSSLFPLREKEAIDIASQVFPEGSSCEGWDASLGTRPGGGGQDLAVLWDSHRSAKGWEIKLRRETDSREDKMVYT